MNKVICFVGGLVLGGAAGSAATYFIIKNKTEDYINSEIEKAKDWEVSKTEEVDDKEPYSDDEVIEADTIPELAEMAKKAKSEDSEKTDYTGFSKSKEKKGDDEVKKPIEYINEEEGFRLEGENNYVIEDMTYFSDDILAYDIDNSKCNPDDLGIENISDKFTDDQLYVANHAERKVYAIIKVDEKYSEMIEEETEDDKSN